ncbi:MAG: hypothetical protein WBC69_17420 [Geitlerinemataceae cyanobacterium]
MAFSLKGFCMEVLMAKLFCGQDSAIIGRSRQRAKGWARAFA